MRQILNFLKTITTPEDLSTLIWFLFAITAIPAIYFFCKNTDKLKKTKNLLYFICIILIGIIYANTFDVIEERYHLIIFGILGYIYAKDIFKNDTYKTLVLTSLFTLLVATTDEIFQYHLPYRVGDPRDVLFGVVGGIWGCLIFISIHHKGR